MLKHPRPSPARLQYGDKTDLEAKLNVEFKGGTLTISGHSIYENSPDFGVHTYKKEGKRLRVTMPLTDHEVRRLQGEISRSAEERADQLKKELYDANRSVRALKKELEEQRKTFQKIRQFAQDE